MQEGDTKDATGAGGIHGDAQQCLTPQPPPPLTPMTADQDPPRGDPSESDVPACALRCGPQGAPSVADGVHGDDEIEKRDVTEDTGPGVAQECLTPHSGCGVVTPSDQGSPVPLAVSLGGGGSGRSIGLFGWLGGAGKSLCVCLAGVRLLCDNVLRGSLWQTIPMLSVST